MLNYFCRVVWHSKAIFVTLLLSMFNGDSGIAITGNNNIINNNKGIAVIVFKTGELYKMEIPVFQNSFQPIVVYTRAHLQEYVMIRQNNTFTILAKGLFCFIKYFMEELIQNILC